MKSELLISKVSKRDAKNSEPSKKWIEIESSMRSAQGMFKRYEDKGMEDVKVKVEGIYKVLPYPLFGNTTQIRKEDGSFMVYFYKLK